MAVISGGDYRMQQVDHQVIVFHRHIEEEIVRYDVRDSMAMQAALQIVATVDKLNMEEKVCIGFWAGYFYVRANV